MPNPKINLLEFGLLPRGMRRDVAAAYVGACVTKFMDGVKSGTYPQPNAEGVWDRAKLDAHFDGKLETSHPDPFAQRERELNGEC